MSTKTIAVGTEVYEKLSQQKRMSESFTKVIDRLVSRQLSPTCGEAVRQTREIFGDVDTSAEADGMDRLLTEGKSKTGWDVETPS